MHVTVRLFAALRDRAGTSELSLALPDGARVADALAAVADLTADVPVVMAVNREYADTERELAAGDELALIPPVSGGARNDDIHVRITDEALALASVVARVSDPRAGAIVTFTGVTREVPALEYEAYAEMAANEIRRIAEAAVAAHGLCAAAVEHRTGSVALGEASVAIAVSAPHRAEAFTGAREIIDRIKEVAPIWKREAGDWVAGALPAAERRPDHPTG